MDSLHTLVTRAQGGDRDAYGQLVGRFQDMAYGYAYALIGDFDLAQDVAQEAFIEAYRCLPALREPLAFPGWFKRIVFKQCDRLTRGRWAQNTSLDAAGALAAREPGPAEWVERRERQEGVLRAVRALPDREREVTALYYIDGYSQDEIAAFLEVPGTTVKSRLHTARRRLKERMLDMVRETFESNALPENFTQETLDQAVAQAAAWNQERRFDRAEALLRSVLHKAPAHPAALQELNRALMWGRVYGQARWDLLPELAAHGRQILAAGGGDPHIYEETAQTLLAVPAMPEAVAFLEGWIAAQGPAPDRVGMLAWAQGCVAEYDRAEALWEEFLTLARAAPAEAAATAVQQVSLSLVDCFITADEIERAERVAREGWALARSLGAAPHEYGRPQGERTDAGWADIFRRAGLPLEDPSRELLDRLGPEADRDLRARGAALSIRAWVEDAAEWADDWRAWVEAGLAAGADGLLQYVAGQIIYALRATRRPSALTEWARTARQWLAALPGEGARALHDSLKWGQYNGWAFLDAGDLRSAERVARQAVEEEGYVVFGAFLIDIAMRRGEPTPPDVVRFIEQEGVEAIDEYGREGWYVIAREAAAAGDADRAFDALERALAYWSNPPYLSDAWQRDAYWGPLRQRPEFKRLFAAKRARIGPVYGQLHYFPGW